MKMDRARVKFNIFFLLLSCFTAHSLADAKTSKENPFTPKASLIRYWNNHISNKLPHSTFLLSKASPLSPQESSFFAKLAAEKSISSHLPAFCSSADLFCLVGSKPVAEHPTSDADFAVYTTNKQFSSYGNARLGGTDEFKNYSDGVNFAAGSFSRYSRGSTAHLEAFASYAPDVNVATGNFSSYASGATGGSGDFKAYMARVNVPDLRFSSYDSASNGHKLAFASYSDDTNSGNQAFVGYGRSGNSAPVGFTSYGRTSNVVGSGFTEYGLSGNAANDSFKGYSVNANNPSNNFRNYGGGGNGGTDTFSGYRDSANAGTDTFQSYGRSSSSENASFVNYGKSFNQGFDTFKEYAKGAEGHAVGFKIYGFNSSTFKEYAQKKGASVTFAQYAKTGGVGNRINHGWVEQGGKFFRESMLKEGRVMKMPNIRDWMPKRSFLPRAITSRLPFSSDQLGEIKRTFEAGDNSTMERVLVNALNECEREPSPGETKRCVGSAEDMIDFAVSVLGGDVVVRSTEGVEGSGEEVVVGEVNGGVNVTRSVSCHQSMYPYLLYYCHSVPKVRVYEADILDAEGKARINHGVAICHLDTSAWSPTHAAFLALGSSPGLIEVCHWIFENDMTWTSAHNH